MRLLSQTSEAIWMRKQTATKRFNHSLTHVSQNVSERGREKKWECVRQKKN